MTDMTEEGNAHKILAQIKNLLNALPYDYRHRHKLKLSKIQSILSELNSMIDIPVAPSILSPTTPSTFISKEESSLQLQNDPPKVEAQSTKNLDVDSLLKTLKSDLIEDLKTKRPNLMKGTRENS